MRRLILIVSSLLSAEIAASCHFPVSMRGAWYQGGNAHAEFVISSNRMTTKGVCVDRKGDFYLLHQANSGYSTCLLIKQYHNNAIRYQQRFLEGNVGSASRCKTNIGSMVQTMIRQSGRPTSCPFQGAFHFAYNNNMGGFCRNPHAQVKSCASDTQLLFRFRHCPTAAYTYSRDMHFECLARWEESDQHYMIARLRGKELSTENDRYRCFLYKVQGSLVYLAMSEDASCRGLISPMDGPSVLELSRDFSEWPHPMCKFPNWVSDIIWRDLSNQYVYETNKAGDTLRLMYRRSTMSHPQAEKTFRCARLWRSEPRSNQIVLLSYTSVGCSMKFTCLKIVRRTRSIIEVYEGNTIGQVSECTEYHMDNVTYNLLIPDRSTPITCPSHGRYAIRTGSNVCRSYFRSGCDGSTVLDITSSCSSRPGIQLECLNSWRSGQKNYVVARKLGDKGGPANCFSFRSTAKSPTMQFAIDYECNGREPSILRDSTTYVMDYRAGSCAERQPMTKVATVKTAPDTVRRPPPPRDEPVVDANSRADPVDVGHVNHVVQNTGALINSADDSCQQTLTCVIVLACVLISLFNNR